VAAAALLLVLVASGAVFGGAYLRDRSQPTAVAFGFRDGQREIGVLDRLQFTATRPIAPAAFKTALRVAPSAPGELHASTDNRLFTWRPSQPLAELTEYTLTLSPLRDASGHEVKAARWRFTTTVVPRVIGLSTEAGAAVSDQGEIAAGSHLRVSFNEAMDATSVKLLANGAPVDLRWSADGRSAALQSPQLKIGSLELRLQDGSRDSAGRVASAWSIRVSVIFQANLHTLQLKAPALVQVPNDPAARDQSGLQAADSVYEYDTEGDITRLTAVYSRVPDVVGPSRSARLISFALTRHLHGMLFMSGLSSGSAAQLAAAPVPHADDLVPGIFYRTGNRRPPNNLFITGMSVQQNEERAGVPAYSLERGAVHIPGGDDGGSATVSEHRSTYTYDGETGTYTKAEDGHQLLDAAIAAPLRIQLLIVMHTTAKTTSFVEDVNGVHALDFDMESGGRADFYYGGRHAGGKWSAADRQTPFKFELDGGDEVKMPLGLAWIDVVRS
jgi:hypothetical protein